MTGLIPDDRDLATALKKITAEETFYGDRSQKVLVVTEKAGGGYEVRARLSPKQVRKGAHLARVREIRAENNERTMAIIHINLRGTTSCALVALMGNQEGLYRLRPQKPPREGLRWVTVTDHQRERWAEVWSKL